MKASEVAQTILRVRYISNLVQNWFFSGFYLKKKLFRIQIQKMNSENGFQWASK